MDIKQIVIAYSGSLDAYQPAKKGGFLNGIKKWIWTYKHDTVDASTRSAYYLIKALEILKNKYGITPKQISIQLWGNINPINLDQARKAGVNDFFKIEGYKEKSQSLQDLQQADMLFLPLEMSNTTEFGTLFIPGKLFEYIHAKKPILALCEPSDCRDILEQSGLGVVVEPNQPEKIALKLLDIIQNPNLLQTYKPNISYIETFDFKNKVKELSEVFDALNVK